MYNCLAQCLEITIKLYSINRLSYFFTFFYNLIIICSGKKSEKLSLDLSANKTNRCETFVYNNKTNIFSSLIKINTFAFTHCLVHTHGDAKLRTICSLVKVD